MAFNKASANNGAKSLVKIIHQSQMQSISFIFFLFSGLFLANKGLIFCDSYDINNCLHQKLLLTMTALMLIGAVIVFAISIWAIATNSSAIKKARGCASCCCQESTPKAPVVIYLPANQVITNHASET